MEIGGVIPIEQSAVELKAFVERVLEETGAPEVDLVGHSEGTFMPQFWLKFLGGAKVVRRYVALTPLYEGTQLARADMIRDIGATLGFDDEGAGLRQPVLRLVPAVRGRLGDGQAARGGRRPRCAGVRYTTIPTTYDELVIPWQSGLLDAPNATNRVLQEVCPNDTSEHAALAVDPVVAQLIFNALDPAMAVEPVVRGRAAGLARRPRPTRPARTLLETTLRARVRRHRVRRLRLRSCRRARG